MLELHRQILGDSKRNKAFYDALKAVIKPGSSVVCDIGSGTGFLSFLAAKLGAKKCYMFEQSPVAILSKELATINKMDRCELIHMHSTNYKKKIEADVVVSETLGNYALEENIVESMEHAKRFLKSGGHIIPQKIEQFIAPVIRERLYRDTNVWDDVGYGIDLSPAKKISLNAMYVKVIMKDDIPSDESMIRLWDTVDFAKKNSSIRKASIKWKTDEPMTVFGFALWWKATLGKNIVLSTSPFDDPTHWEQIYLPILDPAMVEAGETIELSLESDTRMPVKINLAWTMTVWSKDNMPTLSQHLDMLDGFLPGER